MFLEEIVNGLYCFIHVYNPHLSEVFYYAPEPDVVFGPRTCRSHAVLDE